MERCVCLKERSTKQATVKWSIALEKKHVFHHENNFTYQKGALT